MPSVQKYSLRPGGVMAKMIREIVQLNFLMSMSPLSDW